MIQESLSGEEWTLVNRLRGIPEGAERDELIALVSDLVEFVHDPHCAEAQADGVPCRSVQLDCAECQDVLQTLTTLRDCLRLG